MADFLDVNFHAFELIFQPYKEQTGKMGSFGIFKSCVKKINDTRTENRRYIIIDRHENRDKAESRRLFVSRATYSHSDRMYKCRINLLRDKVPAFLDREKMTISSDIDLKDKELVETTNFYVDLEKHNNPTVICEYNNLGPKISDIEYYFRTLSSRKFLHISKACKAQVHMEKSVEQVINSMENVFKFRFKARPESLPALFRNTQDSFISNMQALANTVDPKSVKVDLSFRETGGKKLITEKNYKMLSTSKKILQAVINDTKVMEDIEDFYLEYEDSEGNDNDFSLVRGKVTLYVKCPYKKGKKGQLDTEKLFDLANEQYMLYKAEKMNVNDKD
ncbi:hypothetical protein ATE92_1756 [Ulvibacter sp. MAR_2010_11]|uniref:hypothetical protein n=1 Tax=Ulvibacter sp. MAR_2010_11 TaxID=1250229 RepID=UPI000C2B9913|nr:hypothetical protein [Ulvibacter sp. MAR_2010_11]PKA83599.1 hypothetical protein ATE92_1756 [Ulvibacter sp. MAR_2010_11]